MSLSLVGITKANLTVMTTSGQPSVILDASGFRGTTNLTATGSGTAILFGGSGNGGKLTAVGTGNNILIGGAGTDTLTDTSGGHNILIGGGGADTITGNGKDILISGTTSYDSNSSANIAALDAILAEWASSDLYKTRINKIMAGVGSGGTAALNTTTVHSDGLVNTLSDGSQPTQNNWFFASSQDNITKKQANEVVTTIN
jgi:Ca2+-binding RTX toxin-like protein